MKRLHGRSKLRSHSTSGSLNAEFALILVILMLFVFTAINLAMSGMSALYIYLVTYESASKVAKETSPEEIKTLLAEGSKRLKEEPLAKFFHTSTDFEGGGMSLCKIRTPMSTSAKKEEGSAAGICSVRTRCRLDPLIDMSGIPLLKGVPFISKNTIVEFHVESFAEHPEILKEVETR